MAIARGHAQLVQLLLDNQADVKALTGIKTSAMDIAADRGNLDAIRLLLLHGVETLQGRPKRGSLTPPLHRAIERGHTGDNQLVQLLLDKKANPAELTGEGHSAMHIAATNGNHQAIRLLLLHGAERLPTEGALLFERDPMSVINEPDHGVELEYEKARRSLCHAHCEPSTTRDSTSLTRGPVRLRRSRK